MAEDSKKDIYDKSIFRDENNDIKDDFEQVVQEKDAQKDIQQEQENTDNNEINENIEVIENSENDSESTELSDSEINKIEEDEEEASNFKKYIFYISKDYVKTIDNLAIDERAEFINDAIQLKIDKQNNHHKTNKVNEVIIQAIVVFFTVCFLTPVAIFVMNKSIMVTFENYKYSQNNFEKLYKQRFESDKAFMRSVQYNEAMKILSKDKH